MRFRKRRDAEDADHAEVVEAAEPTAPAVEDVPIRDEVIRLGQFLKLANLIESGAEAKDVVGRELVSVNGEVETRRGRQLVPGDVVTLGGVSARVARGDGEVDVPW